MRKLIDSDQKIYTFLNENEELMVSQPKDNDEDRITDIVYTKHNGLDSLSVACHLSSDGADTLRSYLILNTINIDLFNSFSCLKS